MHICSQTFRLPEKANKGQTFLRKASHREYDGSPGDVYGLAFWDCVIFARFLSFVTRLPVQPEFSGGKCLSLFLYVHKILFVYHKHSFIPWQNKNHPEILKTCLNGRNLF